MRKRTKTGDSSAKVPTPTQLESINDVNESIETLDLSRINPSSKSKSLISGKAISVMSDKAAKEKKAPEKDLKLLHQKAEEPADGRVESHDASRNNGWRKIEFTIDQQIPICKDFRDTGYCTWGGACKYYHTREDTPSTSQMDTRNAWKAHMETEQRKEFERRRKKIVTLEPDVCQICHKLLKDPIITKCEHQFCSTCAMKRYLTDPTCAICGKDTDGIFNTAPK
ncbi:Pre-mRNA-splicing factor CWC24 [Tritrichomonas foetus]|uniref:Pre-mRNA-splicing factor CWC24 n=1 Tax=Tritrichomonas foetus TaxID=1144522 RepID=A0A1J4K5G0_9EUKA|nr:Pre-mRNA-splicing factor CWC24 [Tritrichomonas foetus]|eukprot:OHT06631.1 Pre-mRNA-splicing factor CWC24 [Tritrichomonas foetus]